MAASSLLRFGGRFCLCQRPERLCDSIQAFRQAGLEPKRLRFVHQTATSAPSAVLVCAKRGAADGLTVEPPLLVCGADGALSDEYRAIYHK